MKLDLEVKDITKKEVKQGGNSGRIYVPKEWIGKKIYAILPAEEEGG